MNKISDHIFKKITDYDDRWALLQGHLDGQPIFTRYREGLIDAVGHPAYPFQIGVAVPLLKPTANGLPEPNEGDQLFVVEDALTAALEEDQAAVHAMTITFNNMLEFVFYASEWKPEYYEQKVESVRQRLATAYKLQFMMQEDKEWGTFKKYSAMR